MTTYINFLKIMLFHKKTPKSFTKMNDFLIYQTKNKKIYAIRSKMNRFFNLTYNNTKLYNMITYKEV